MESRAEKSWRHRTDSERLVVRSCEALLGLCSGLMADGKVNDEEITFLANWLDDHEAITAYWPGDILASRVKQVLTDGVITEDEREHLKETLSSLIRGTMQETGATSGKATDLPINPNADIILIDKTFCFTGTFVYGNRKKCEAAVIDLGGIISKRITQKMDYLVLGSLITGSWAQTSFGRKIEKAIDYQRKGFGLEIIGEDHWLKHIEKSRLPAH